MATSKKISQLDEIDALDPADILPIVDDSTSTTKKVSIAQLTEEFVSDPYIAEVASFTPAAGTPADGDPLQTILEKISGNQIAQLCEVLLFTASSGYTATGSYAAAPGMTAQTIVIPFTGNFLLHEFVDYYNSSGTDVNAFLGILVDGVTLYEIPSAQTQNTFYTARLHGDVRISLTAGSHSFQPVVKKTGSGSLLLAPGPNFYSQITITGQGMVGELTQVQPTILSNALSTPYQIVSHTVTDTGIVINFDTTVSNQKIPVGFVGWVWEMTGGAHTVVLYLQLDGGSDIEMTRYTMPGSYIGNMSFSYPRLVVPTPGSHVLKLRTQNFENTTARSDLSGELGIIVFPSTTLAFANPMSAVNDEIRGSTGGLPIRYVPYDKTLKFVLGAVGTTTSSSFANPTDGGSTTLVRQSMNNPAGKYIATFTSEMYEDGSGGADAGWQLCFNDATTPITKYLGICRSAAQNWKNIAYVQDEIDLPANATVVIQWRRINGTAVPHIEGDTEMNLNLRRVS